MCNDVVRKLWLVAFLIFLFIQPFRTAAATSSVSLAWDPSPDTNVVSYNLYYGGSSESYTNKVTVGNVTLATVSGLLPGAKYYFAATAVNIENLESEFSNEAAYTVPIPTNATPTLNPLVDITLNENSGPQIVTLSGITSGSPTEAQALQITAVSSNPTLIPNPAVNYVSPSQSGTLSFTPVAGASGTATITVAVNDGQAINNLTQRQFTITVAAGNRPPTLDPIADVFISQNSAAKTVALSGISSGAANETQPLTLTAISSDPAVIPNPVVSYISPSSTATLSVSPVANASGDATITVTVSDGQTANSFVQRQFMVVVSPGNRAPTLNQIADLTLPESSAPKTVQLSGIGSGSSEEIQTLQVTAVSSNPSLIPNPLVTYTSPSSVGSLLLSPTAGASGTALITVTVNDGQTANATFQRQFNVTVTPGNRPPTLDAIADLSLLANSAPQTVQLSGISPGSSTESQNLRITAISSNPSLVPAPIVNYSSPSPSGSLVLSPVANASGSATITVSVDDGQAVNNLTQIQFTVTVTPGNLPPTLEPLLDVTTVENSGAQAIQLVGIGSGSTSESQVLKIRATSSNPVLVPNPTVQYVSPAAEGTLTFMPAPDSVGVALITVEVDDGQPQNNLVRRSFAITVQRVLADVTFSETGIVKSETGEIPVNLLTTQPAKELIVSFEAPAGLFTNAKLQDLAPEVGVSSVSLGTDSGSVSTIQFKSRANKEFSGDQVLGMLTFTTASGSSSEFVKVRVIKITAKLADGSQLTKDVDYVTRIAVIGEQSLLDLQPKGDGSKSLILFGKPAKTYAIEYSTNGADGPWTRLSTTIPLEGTSAKVENLPQTGTFGFYRSVELP